MNTLEIPGEKIAGTVDEESYITMRYFFKKAPRMLNQRFSSILKGVATYRNNHAYWLIEDTMQILIQAGIPQYIKKSMFIQFFKAIPQPVVKVPKVFSIDDLRFCFVVWLITCSVAIGVFLIEIIFFYGKTILIGILGLYEQLRRTLKRVFLSK